MRLVFLTLGLLLCAVSVLLFYQRSMALHERSEALEALSAALAAAPRGDERPQALRAPAGARVEVQTLSAVPVELAKAAVIPADEVPRRYLGADDLAPGDRFVKAGDTTAAPGSGTRDDPWRSLSHALAQLQPGDRLVVLSGRYQGPLRIGNDVAAGTAQAPITVHFTSNAELIGPQPGDPVAAGHHDDWGPLVSIARDHWHLEGLNVIGGYSNPVVSIEGGVSGIRLASPHIRAAAGSGLVVADGVSGIELTDLHLHHLGSLEGRDHDRRALYARPQEAPFVALALPEHGVMLEGGKIHHIFGQLGIVSGPDGKRALDDETFSGWDIVVSRGEQRWW
ncbi:hypothetical protein [uncultured Thiohalocapsa sp.]|uniref:hypothetical protein n=1 Tax=uncultured Thiohalocapsa sp. TaxID=768990 RepID=UPI0025F778DC|nr:hypothetical protein [uncultured Thiohalocapsa sp.]